MKSSVSCDVSPWFLSSQRNTLDLAANPSKHQTPHHSATPCPVVFSCFIKEYLFLLTLLLGLLAPLVFSVTSFSQLTTDNKKWVSPRKKKHNVIHILINFQCFVFFFASDLEKITIPSPILQLQTHYCCVTVWILTHFSIFLDFSSVCISPFLSDSKEVVQFSVCMQKNVFAMGVQDKWNKVSHTLCHAH